MNNRILAIAASAALLAGLGGSQAYAQDGQAAASADSAASCSPARTGPATKAERPLGQADARSFARHPKPLLPGLPTIGLLMYDKVLMTELTAPLDVFAKPSEDGRQLFNVITIAKEYRLYTCEEGLRIFPDYTLADAPDLDVLMVPSTYDMADVVKDKDLVAFVRRQNSLTDYTVSNCAGATLIGESGIADGKRIVTWIGGGEKLQETYPNLLVQDDAKVSFVEDGKFMSSNGNLATYISSLELLERMTSPAHRKYVESHLYLDRLRNWKK